MSAFSRGRRLVGAAGAGVLALALGSAGVATGVTTAAAAAATTAGTAAPAGARPGVGVNPPRHLAGRIPPGMHSALPTHFGCQSLNATFRCYGPDQMRRAYGIDTLIESGYTGAGKTIVIVDAYQSPTIDRDLRQFDSVFGLPSSRFRIIAPQGLTPFDKNSAVQRSWSYEISLDVEWAHAIAPGAAIELVLAKSSDDKDIQAAVQYAVDQRLGDVLSMSFGEAEQCYGVLADGTREEGVTLADQHAIFAKAKRERMTLFASAGDSGSTELTCDGISPMVAASSPASDPLVTSVGGTQLTAGPVTGIYHHEVVWDEQAVFGGGSVGGGGFSKEYAQPGWQRSAGNLSGRGVPDVSYDAAINGSVLVAYSATAPYGSFYLLGGTSSAAPQWAALTADIDQLNGKDLGFINPALYRIARTTAGAFHDITRGQNGSYGLPGFTAGPGWDAASGLGTPVAGTLAMALSGRH